MTMRTLRSALCATVIAAGCGGGSDDGNGGNPPREDGGETPGTCGNGACDTGESCGNCADCACPAGQTCSGGSCVTDQTPRCGDGRCDTTASETCMSCEEDCGCGTDRRCHAESGTCVSANPLIDAIPGTWDLLEVDGEPPPGGPVTVELWTDLAQPLCDYPSSPPGDACIRGFSGPPPILDGMRLYIPNDGSGITLEGQVLNEGTRIEFDYSDGVVTENDAVWIKRP